LFKTIYRYHTVILNFDLAVLNLAALVHVAILVHIVIVLAVVVAILDLIVLVVLLPLTGLVGVIAAAVAVTLAQSLLNPADASRSDAGGRSSNRGSCCALPFGGSDGDATPVEAVFHPEICRLVDHTFIKKSGWGPTGGLTKIVWQVGPPGLLQRPRGHTGLRFS
jgi:hypothetical protein